MAVEPSIDGMMSWKACGEKTERPILQQYLQNLTGGGGDGGKLPEMPIRITGLHAEVRSQDLQNLSRNINHPSSTFGNSYYEYYHHTIINTVSKHWRYKNQTIYRNNQLTE
jgi:hypothetical protein